MCLLWRKPNHEVYIKSTHASFNFHIYYLFQRNIQSAYINIPILFVYASVSSLYTQRETFLLHTLRRNNIMMSVHLLVCSFSGFLSHSSANSHHFCLQNEILFPNFLLLCSLKGKRWKKRIYFLPPQLCISFTIFWMKNHQREMEPEKRGTKKFID